MNAIKEAHPSPLAANLTQLLKEKGLSLAQLAHILDIPVMTIRRLMSGETEDPRLSTLKLITDYFEISIDQLINSDTPIIMTDKKCKPCLVPKLSWQALTELHQKPFTELTSQWESIFLNQNASNQSFALESRPSLYPRFPRGTVFIVDPKTTPVDGDIVLVKFKENNEFNMKELFIDPPHWILSSTVGDSGRIPYEGEMHDIMGVVIGTLFFNARI